MPDKPPASDKARHPQTKAKTREGTGGNGHKADTFTAPTRSHWTASALHSHAGWAAGPLSSLHAHTHLDISHILALIAILLGLTLAISPASWIAYIAVPIYPLIPSQVTLQALSQAKQSRGHTDGPNVPQWTVLWVGMSLYGAWARVHVVFRPGDRALVELTRVMLAVVLAGPWLGRMALVSGVGHWKKTWAQDQTSSAESNKAAKSETRSATDGHKEKR